MPSSLRQILDLNAYQGSSSDSVNPLLERRLRNAGPASVLFYRKPIEMVSASGAWMVAADGTRYLDFYNNVPSVGHCHPRVTAAVTKQIAKLNINSRYLSSVVEDYLDKLKATFPREISNVVLTCSGSEANDLALRVASKATGGTGYVVTEGAYHGNTFAVTQISPAALKRGSLPDHVVAIPAPTSDATTGETLAANLRQAITTLEARGHKFAAFICDSIFSSDGIFADPPGFLKDAVAAARKAGGLYIADEVQPGFARSGDSFWGFGRHGVVPDIVTMGKPMGNGFPMAGMATRPDLLERFCEEVGYFNTFGGTPVAAAAGTAVLEVIRDEGLLQNARTIGGYLKAQLRDIAKSHRSIGEIRGSGLFIGVDLVRQKKPDPARASKVINDLKDKGVLVGAAGRHGHTLKLRPPLSLTQQEADIFADTFASAIES